MHPAIKKQDITSWEPINSPPQLPNDKTEIEKKEAAAA